MLHGPLEGLLDPIAAFVDADSPCGHTLVQADHERVESDAEGDHRHASQANVDQAEGEQQRVGEHEKAESEAVEVSRSKVDDPECDLDDQAGQEESAPPDRQLCQACPAPAGHDHDQYGSGNGHSEKPHPGLRYPRWSYHARTRCRSSAWGYAAAVHEIRSEIPASVWRVLVDEGQLVAEGDEIVVLESMKMEIPVITEIPGVVRELHVEPADSIQAGDLIALIDES